MTTPLVVCRACRQSLRNAANRKHARPYSTARTKPFRVGIIGSGPAGFYAAHRMVQKMPEIHVDMYEALPTPYGLVRFGVAPDHPEVKNCIETFEKVASHPSFTFIGNLTLGTSKDQLPLPDLAPHYDALLFSYGASRDRKLGIPGEDLEGVHSARAFVGWYNGLPEYSGMSPDLSNSENAVVIGQGNVALDVARILLSPLDALRKTDITEEALEVWSRNRVRKVSVVGRRGPLQAPYTIKELRELMQLPGTAFDPIDRNLYPADLKKLPRQLKRIAELTLKGSPLEKAQAEKEWQLLYMLSPSSFNSTSSAPSSLSSVTFGPTEFTINPSTIDPSDMSALRSLRVRKSTNPSTTLPTSLAFRSVGYQSSALPGFTDLGIPFDESLGIIPNDLHGRVMAPDRGPGQMTAGHVPGMYAAGWVKRGPTGVIATTMDDAFTTADVILRDWVDEVPFIGSEGAKGSKAGDKAGWEGVKEEVSRRGIRSVSWEDWLVIDREEKRRGKERGKEREKCRSVEEMLRILDG